MSLSIGDGGQGKGIRYKERETPYFTKTYPMHIPEYVLIRKKPAVRKRGPQAFCAWEDLHQVFFFCSVGIDHV